MGPCHKFHHHYTFLPTAELSRLFVGRGRVWQTYTHVRDRGSCSGRPWTQSGQSGLCGGAFLRHSSQLVPDRRLVLRKKKDREKRERKKAAGRSHASPVRTCLRAEQCSTRAEDCVHFRYPCPADVERGSSCGTRQKVVKKTPVLARNCPAWA